MTVSQVRYIDDATGLPTTTVVTGKLHAGWLFARDSFFLEATASEAYIAAVEMQTA